MLYDLLRASKSVILKINEISSSEEITRTIEVAEVSIRETFKENYLKFQSAVETQMTLQLMRPFQIGKIWVCLR